MKLNETLGQKKFELLEYLEGKGITSVIIHYDGSGDEGQIENIVAYKGKKEVDIQKMSLEYPTEESTFNDKKKEWDRSTVVRTEALYAALQDFANDFLEHCGIDWYNNDGGYGQVVITVNTGKVKAEHNARVTDTQYEEHEA